MILASPQQVWATTVFPVLIPTLTAISMTIFNARALAYLVTVVRKALSRRLTVILNLLVKAVESDCMRHCCLPEGLDTIMLLLLGWCIIHSICVEIPVKCQLIPALCHLLCPRLCTLR